MTKKRFEEYDNGFEDKIKNEYFETNKEIVDRLNALYEENEQLKQRITTQSVDREQLCKRIDEVRKENEQLKQFQEKVFSWLDKEIAQNEEAIEWGNEMGASTGAMGFYNNMLKMLQKELQE